MEKEKKEWITHKVNIAYSMNRSYGDYFWDEYDKYDSHPFVRIMDKLGGFCFKILDLLNSLTNNFISRKIKRKYRKIQKAKKVKIILTKRDVDKWS